MSFREVGTGDSPDILIAWTQAKCGDADMTVSVLNYKIEVEQPGEIRFYAFLTSKGSTLELVRS